MLVTDLNDCFYFKEILFFISFRLNMNTEEIKLYTKCINFAAVKHRNQRRLDADKTPYINHPIGNEQLLDLEA